MRAALSSLAVITLPLAVIAWVDAYALLAWQTLLQWGADALCALFHTALFLTVLFH